jgi:hydrogenase maturation factor
MNDPRIPEAADQMQEVASREDFHCITCSDEALPAKVLRVDQETQSAQVSIMVPSTRGDVTEEVDVSLVDLIAPGDLILVHGGVALARLSDGEE